MDLKQSLLIPSIYLFDTMSNLYYITGCGYSQDKNKIYITLYNPEKDEIVNYEDKTGYMPYFFVNKNFFKILKDKFKNEIVRTELVTKFDAIENVNKEYIKVVGKDPILMSSISNSSLYNRITDYGGKVWEQIKFIQSYIYDKNLNIAMPYFIHEKYGLIPYLDEESDSNVKSILEKFKDEPETFMDIVKTWAMLCEYKVPNCKRVAVDIEVLPNKSIFPDPNIADRPVISVAFYGSDGRKIVLILRQPDKPLSFEGIKDCELKFFNDEKELLSYCYELLQDYKWVLTFNGDKFDLPYLKNRGLNLGFKSKDIPIILRKRSSHIRNGLHIDLYNFFSNVSIKNYAFGGKYKSDNLDEISEVLLGETKLHHGKDIKDLSYVELVNYNLKDVFLTLKLTTFDDNIVFHLIWVISRLSRMGIEDVSRFKVSQWIKSFIYYEHRRNNIIIPRQSDLLSVKGTISTTAIIKDRKYQGAIVVEPKNGIHFNVAVMDFPSLYPSIIKIWNLGYQTVRCPHSECRDNLIPNTNHWLCKKNHAIESLLVGALRDLRVKCYKNRAKDEKLSKEQRNWYNIVQGALKVILNASYGVFGAESFDLYCPPVAESITAIGRHYITEIFNHAKELNIQVLYGDTDSLFLKNPSKEQIEDLSCWAEQQLKISIDMEKMYRYAVFSGRKKNYLGVLENGLVDVKGLTGKKKHTPKIIKEMFEDIKNILKDVHGVEDFENAKSRIKRRIQQTYACLKNRTYDDIKDLTFNMVLKNDLDEYGKTVPQHVSAARQILAAGGRIQKGETVSYIKICRPSSKKSKIKTNVYPTCKPIELYKVTDELNIDAYLKFLRNVCQQIIEPLNIDWEQDILGLTKFDKYLYLNL